MVLSSKVQRRCVGCKRRSWMRGECFVVVSRFGVRRECASFVCGKCGFVELVEKKKELVRCSGCGVRYFDGNSHKCMRF